MHFRHLTCKYIDFGQISSCESSIFVHEKQRGSATIIGDRHPNNLKKKKKIPLAALDMTCTMGNKGITSLK